MSSIFPSLSHHRGGFSPEERTQEALQDIQRAEGRRSQLAGQRRLLPCWGRKGLAAGAVAAGTAAAEGKQQLLAAEGKLLLAAVAQLQLWLPVLLRPDLARS